LPYRSQIAGTLLGDRTVRRCVCVDFADLKQNGLQSTPPHKPGFFARLLRLPVKENAIIEITNLLAEKTIRSVSLTQDAEIL